MIERHRRIARIVFVVYAITLFVATHKPGVDVNVVPGIRLDLFVHASAFAVWTALLGLTGWLGDARSPRGLWMLLAVGVAYAIVDEASQAVPIFDRVFDVKDMLANSVGAVAAAIGVFCIGRVRRGAGSGAEAR
ncbi:MAG: VanZ family protein [Phycisphaerales bacterium]